MFQSPRVSISILSNALTSSLSHDRAVGGARGLLRTIQAPETAKPHTPIAPPMTRRGAGVLSGDMC